MRNTVNILGTDYQILYVAESDHDPKMENNSGYVELHSKKIVLLDIPDDPCNVENIEDLKRSILRHEIVHAFLHESGLGQNIAWGSNNEGLVDWIAMQMPKLIEAFESVDALN